MNISIDLEVTDGFIASINGLKAAFSGNAPRSILLAAAMVVRNAAIPKAPYLTGTLRRSIRTEVEDDAVIVGTDVPYSRRLEYGFTGTDSKGRHYNQAATPYMRPAFDETRDEQMKAAIDAANELLRNAGVFK